MNDGRFGENVVARIVRARGCSIVPIRDIDMREHWKGPRLTGPEGMEVVCADWLVIAPEGKTCWMEVKTKSRCSWHRFSRSWNTGIDQHYLDHYAITARRSDIPVWLVFLHLNETPSDEDVDGGAPPKCPTGLFGGEVLRLARVGRSHANHGKGGMVYWRMDQLTRLATDDEIAAALREERSGQ